MLTAEFSRRMVSSLSDKTACFTDVAMKQAADFDFYLVSKYLLSSIRFVSATTELVWLRNGLSLGAKGVPVRVECG